MIRPVRLFLSALALVALAACGAGAVPADDVEAQATQQFSQQFPVDSVDCEDDLPAEVGATIDCVLVSEGSSFVMTATVESVEGGTANFNLELTEEL